MCLTNQLSDSGTGYCSCYVAGMEQLDAGKRLPDYFKKHPIYYAGPAKTPEYPSSAEM